MHGSEIMARMARAAYEGGAVGIRANGPEDIAAIKAAVPLPVIGIYKLDVPGYQSYITPTFDSAREVAEAGADMIAIHATAETRPPGQELDRLIGRIHNELGKPVMADVSTLEEGLVAARLGADVVSSTLAGYTAYSRKMEGPDFLLVEELLSALSVPVIAEGRIHTPDDAAHALELGCYAVVVGGAITRPQEITKRFTHRIAHALK
jgi:N-acylglucosamine-6-phosphate 2-epimerase